ncbi:MAG: class I SAM-dependent methyltransferase [Candidatus Hodarchaeales archaeon]|jgi:ubiquinone/menaquinone biosynthesis C-methylase UbiE
MSSPFSCFDWASSFYDTTRAIPAGLIRQIVEKIQQLSKIKPSTKILEVGIGTGRIAIPLSSQLNVDIVGVDISEKMIQKCQDKVKSANKIHLIIADGLSLPFPQSTKFDLILTAHLLHLVSDPFLLTNKMLSFLALEGLFINLDAHVNYHDTLPYKIYYEKLAKDNYRHAFRGDLIRNEITIYLSKRGWKHEVFTIEGVKEVTINNVCRFIRDQVFSSTRLIEDDFHHRSLKYLYQELEGRNIDLSDKIIAKVAVRLSFFTRSNDFRYNE